MEVNSLVNSDRNFGLLASALTFLKKEKTNIEDSILEKFYDMPDDFETDSLTLSHKGYTKA